MAHNPSNVLATRDNIVPMEGSPAAQYESFQPFYVEGVDASVGASGVVTVDQPTPGSTAIAADTGALPAGIYNVIAELAHPGAAAANRQLILEHRNAANNATVATLGGTPAGGPRVRVQRQVLLAANERIRIITGTDATNLLVRVRLQVLPRGGPAA